MVDRLLFFSDAVFAIVLTLLVLELRPPGQVGSEAEMAAGLSEMKTHFLAFGISFALGSAFWLVHMRTTRGLQIFDWFTAAANLLHLATVALLPFAAAMLGEHINSIIAFQAYALIMILVSFSGGVLWWIATRGGGRRMGGINQRRRWASLLRTTAIGWCFVVGYFAAPTEYGKWAYFCWLAIFPMMLVARLIAGKEPPREVAARS
jgi:uncharacterized membrane protein